MSADAPSEGKKRLPEKVPGFFPLWEQNMLQTFFKTNPDDSIIADLPILAQAIAKRPDDYLQQLLAYYQRIGGIFKVCLGPKAFLIVSDASVVRHLLSESALKYDKGILADILEPIMGQGLIPADLNTWQGRRRAVVPGFHTAWLQQMTTMFGECADRMTASLDAAGDNTVNMEAMFSSVALDIIGKAVFNYDFASVENQSPVIDAVYNLMQEAEHRSFFLLPYWKVPVFGHRFLGIGPLVPRQAQFVSDLDLVNVALDTLIAEALQSRSEGDVEALEARDYSKLENPSLLRFLVDMRGADATQTQLRDDLMTMMIAGHETTAAMLTWATFCLATTPLEMAKCQEEVDRVLQGRSPNYEDLMALENVRLTLTESLRLYPQPPILIRRALEDDTLPLAWGTEKQVKVFRGTDIFILIWNLHRSPQLWGEDAGEFRPSRWREPRTNPDVPGWKGYTPNPAALYPNEVHSDYAFTPFGAGPRKCVGDQFAFAEATVVLARLLQRYDVSLAVPAEEVGMATGATIHTKAGLPVRLTRRTPL